jgi:hypothetical protein
MAWLLPLAALAAGLVLHLLTLWNTVVDRRRSGIPFLGPLLLCAGLGWLPAHVPGWLYALPWVLELAALFRVRRVKPGP